jgi:DNA-3-methyladenine glycosylase
LKVKMREFVHHQHYPQDFFTQATKRVARDLIGAILVKNDGGTLLAGRIVETEAYLPSNDAASHSFRGQTPRNAAMFGEAGTLYVYRIYGIHLCANVVTEGAGTGAAVLLRALEPLAGIETMQKRRGISSITHLCNGPGKLAQAFGFSLADNFTNLTQSACFLIPQQTQEREPVRVGVSARVGITKDAALPLRFFDLDSAFVSKGKPSV